jgi:hypothetical protein
LILIITELVNTSLVTFFAKMIEVHAQVHVVVFKESIQEQNLSIYSTLDIFNPCLMNGDIFNWEN